MVLDYLGRPLSVGDFVAYIHRTESSAFFERAVVDGFTNRSEKRQVRLKTVSLHHSKIVCQFPDKIIKINNEGDYL